MIKHEQSDKLRTIAEEMPDKGTDVMTYSAADKLTLIQAANELDKLTRQVDFERKRADDNNEKYLRERELTRLALKQRDDLQAHVNGLGTSMAQTLD